MNERINANNSNDMCIPHWADASPYCMKKLNSNRRYVNENQDFVSGQKEDNESEIIESI